jgi:hypothetical protein
MEVQAVTAERRECLVLVAADLVVLVVLELTVMEALVVTAELGGVRQ